MRCKHCHKRLSIGNLLKGQSFCSDEHRELFAAAEATDALERLRSSFGDLAPKKPLPRKQPADAAEPGLAQRWDTASPAEGWADDSNVEQPSAGPIQAAEEAAEEKIGEETPSETAAAESTPGETTEADLAQPTFITSDRPAPQDWSGPLPAMDAAEPIPFEAPTLFGPTFEPEPEHHVGPALDVVPKVSTPMPMAEPSPVEAPPVASNVTWAEVPKGYPPVILSASAKLVLDLDAPELMPLAWSQVDIQTAAPIPQLAEVATPSLEPMLPIACRAGDLDNLAAGLAPAPSFYPAVSGPSSEAQSGLGPVPPAPAGPLSSESDVIRMLPAVTPESRRCLRTVQLYSPLLSAPAAPKQLSVASSTPIPATIAPRRDTHIRPEAPTVGRTLLSAAAFCAVDWTTQRRPGSPASGEFLEAVCHGEIERPRALLAQASTSIGLKPGMDAAPVGCQIAPGLPQTLETAASIAAALPFALATQTVSMVAPALQPSTATRLVGREAQRLPRAVSERRAALSAAHLQPARPSPLSLVTWSRSLGIAMPASRHSNLGRPAAIGVRAIQGPADTLQPWPPSRRGYQVSPSLPHPMANTWAPTAPMWASLRPPIIQPIRPGSEGTATPRLFAFHVQAAEMPVQPVGSDAARSRFVPGLSLSAPAAFDSPALTWHLRACKEPGNSG